MYRLRIKEVAISKGFNQSSLSRATNISFTTIKKIWRDPHYEINIVTLHKIARTLGVPTSELIEDVEESSTHAVERDGLVNGSGLPPETTPGQLFD